MLNNRQGLKSTATNIFSYLIIWPIFTLLLLIFPPPASAQTISLSIWPPIIETTIKPGQAISQNYQLKNLGDDTSITASIVPFQALGNQGHLTLSTTPSPAAGFFSLQNPDLQLNQPFDLKSGETKNLVLQIHVPSDAINTDHYLTLLLTSHTKGLIKATGSLAQATIGSNILLTVSTTNQPNSTLKIDSFSTPIAIDSFSQPPFNLTIKNTSSTRTKPIGRLDIFNLFNRKVATLAIKEDNILAQSTRKLQISQSDWRPFLLLGRFKATATLTPKDTSHTITQTITFYALPYKLIIITIIILGLYRLSKTKKNS